MHCPHCGQQQISSATRFCSRCGFLLSGVAEVMANNGIVPTNPTSITGSGESPRRRGIKMGAFIFLLALVFVPMFGLISMALRAGPFLPALAVFLFGGGGILRIVYALMFESSQPKTLSAGTNPSPSYPQPIGDVRAEPQLMAAHASAESYSPPRQGKWMDTNDLAGERPSVIDHSTKLLEKDTNEH